jgi:hypothetical protein
VLPDTTVACKRSALAHYTVKTDDVMCDMFVVLLYVRVLKIPTIYTGTILIKCFRYITPASSIFHATTCLAQLLHTCSIRQYTQHKGTVYITSKF